jgi:ABC-type amino acid transport substrate-binding protein
MRYTPFTKSALPKSTMAVTTAILCTLTFTFGCSAPKSDTQTISDLGAVKRDKKIVAGWAPYPPYSQKNPTNGKIEGFYISLFQSVADEAGIKVEFVETTWTTVISDLKSGRFQVMAAPVFRTIPRALEVDFTRPVDYFGLSAIVRNGDKRFSQLEDFNSKKIKIATVQGEVGWDFARRHLPQAELVVHQSGNISVALVDVLEGKADAGITDAWTVRQFAAAHPGKVTDMFGSRPFGLVGAGWIVRQDSSDLLRFLNTSIDWLESSGALHQIASGYDLPSFLPPPASQHQPNAK